MTPLTETLQSSGQRWLPVCALEEIAPDTGVAALIQGQQIAVFRLGDGMFAIGNYDPASDAHVLSRGIIGDVDGEIVVASPLYKHHYSLITGRCLEDPQLSVPVFLTRLQDGRVWVRGDAVSRRAQPAKRRLVVIGSGMVAMRTLEELLQATPGAFDITVFGAEPQGSYNRVLLSSLLAGDKHVDDIVTHPPEWFARHAIRLHSGDAVIEIDRARRRVRSRTGIEVAYDRLLLATGSMPLTLAVPGAALPGVMTFRDLQDVDTMIEAARSHHHAVIIGGGLLGLEAACGLAHRGMDVTVVHLASALMERQLDGAAGLLLQQDLERRGLKFVLSANTAEFRGDSRVQAVVLADGRELAADLVVVAVGVRPNIELARSAGLHCRRGVLVDDTLQTFDPAIYAVGECIQHRGQTFGLVNPLWEQAKICAAHLAERGVRAYRTRPDAVQLKVSGIDVFSAGDYRSRPGTESLVLRDPGRGVYKRLVLERDRVCGVVLYGDTQDGTWYRELIDAGTPTCDFRDQLLFGAVAARSVNPPGLLAAAPV